MKMTYKFTDQDLHAIYTSHKIGGEFGPSQAYRYWILDGDFKSPLTEKDDVEGFICEFYTQYNKRIRPGTF
jgi:hypothetical protein